MRLPGRGHPLRVMSLTIALVGLNLAGAVASLWGSSSVLQFSWVRRGNTAQFYYELRDGSRLEFVHNTRGTAVGPFLDRLPLATRLGEFWWPLMASLGVTAVVAALTGGDTAGRLGRFVRRPSVTLKGSMVAVALIGLAVWGLRAVPRSAGYLDRSQQFAWHERREQEELQADRRAVDERKAEASEAERGGASPADVRRLRRYVTVAEQDVADRQTMITHYRALKEKYRRAALCPWLDVGPDPPDPR